jgi:hypothetical protein
VLADPPGAGKTRVVVGLVTGDGAPHAMPPPIEVEIVVRGLVRVPRADHDGAAARAARAPCSDTTLIVVSQSLVAQWEAELRRSAACGGSMAVVRLRKDVERVGAACAAGEATPKVMLVAVLRYAELRAALLAANVCVRRAVVDEAMHMHDAGLAHAPPAAFTWLVTAASERVACKEVVAARSSAYWRDLATLPAEAFGLIVVRTPDAEIVYPGAVRYRHYRCELDTRLAGAAQGVVPAQVRALLEANDIGAAIAALGGTTEEDLMTVVRRRLQHDAQLAQLERARLVLVGAAPARIEQIDARLERLRRDAASAEERFGDALAADCPICHDTLAVPVLVTCCHALFCGECLLTWMHSAMPDPRCATRKCPNCRGEGFRVERIAVAAAAAAEPAPPAPSPAEAAERATTKTEAVVRIVRDARAGVMLYSTHLAGLHAAMRALRTEGHRVEEVKGQSRTRDKRLREFAAGEIKVLALDATINCAGIDLQSLSDVIIYHDMPESVKEQIVGRGHRVNRRADLTVHCLWAA